MLDFLRSPDSDPTKVLLLVLVHSSDEANSTLQYLYRWDTRSPLQTMKPMSCSGRRLKESQLPLMLIPSTRPYSFVAVMETGISYYENVHSSESKRINCQFAGRAASPLEWVQWAKPKRHTKYLEKRDDLVIVREDGLLQYFQIEKASSTKFTMNNTIGHLGFDVDTAFCMLAGPLDKGGDVIIAGGSMTDGGVFHVSARGSPQRTQTIENIAPLRDMIVASPPLGNGRDLQEVANRLYACSSRGDGRGELSEIRYGLEAQIGWTMDYPDAAFIDQLWSLEIPERKELLLLGSHTTHTTMVSFDLESQDISFTDAESHPGFDFDNPTLAAAVVGENTIVQVTTGGVHIIPMAADGTLSKPSGVKADLQVAAFFEGDATVATAGKGLSGFDIRLMSILNSNEGSPRLSPAPSTSLTETPTSIACFTVNETRLLALGTADSSLIVHIVRPDRTLQPVFERQVRDLDGSIEKSAITSLAALCSKETTGALLLCGLRHGVLLCLEVTLDDGRSPSKYIILLCASSTNHVGRDQM